MNAQTMLIDVEAIWNEAIDAGRFRRVLDDPGSARKIEMGLTRDPTTSEAEFYAVDAVTRNGIKKRVERRHVPRSSYVIQLNEFRTLRPKTREGVCALDCRPDRTPLRDYSLWKRDAMFLVTLAASQYVGFPNLLPYNEGAAFLIVPSIISPGRIEFPHRPQGSVLSRSLLQDFLAIRKRLRNTILFYNPSGGSVCFLNAPILPGKGGV